ncbi:S8 family peptidase [Geodermatophilus sp. URMC 60]
MNLDPRLDCLIKMSDPERQYAREMARHRVGLLTDSAEAVTAPVTVRVFVQLTDAAANRPGGLGITGVTPRSRLGDLLTADATPEGLQALADHPDVLFVEQAAPLLSAHRDPEPGGELAPGVTLDIPSGPLTHTGKGVIVGIIDWGCDVTHDDFRDDAGNSRLLRLWDQSAKPGPGRQPPAGYRTGVEFTNEQINAALREPDPFAALGVEPPELAAHGTHVLGIAAGNGRGDPQAGIKGMAPDADLIFVQPDTSDVNIVGGFGDSVHLAEAVKYIFDQASARGRPAVVNLSMGTNSGPHDGSTLVEQWIDRLLGVRGRAVVLALGNEHHERFNRTHSEGRVGPADPTVLYWRVLPNDRSPNEVEVWYSSRDLFELEVVLPDGRRLPTVAPGESTITEIPGSTTRVYQSSVVCSPLNGDNQLNVIVIGSNTQPIEAGAWQLRLTARVAREGTFDAWIERDSMRTPARMSSFLGGSYVRRKTLGSIQSARFAITVSNYDTLTTTLADSTSFGPTRDGRRAPTLAAPGVDILAAKAMWRTDQADRTPYTRSTGTSMSAPYVAGVVACMLQKNPTLTAAQIRGLLVRAAKPAPGFSDEWRIDWGHGRVDPVDTLTTTPALAAPSPDRQPQEQPAAAADGCPPTDDHVERSFHRPGTAPTCTPPTARVRS